MPSGTYLHLDDVGGTRLVERFTCARGPAGWRYDAELRAGDGQDVLGAVDVVVDDAWRQVAVSVRWRDRSVQGGLSGADLVWAESQGVSAAERDEPAAGFSGASPGFVVAVARLLALSQGQGARVRLVHLGLPGLQARAVDEAWALRGVTTYPTDLRPLDVEHYQVTDLATGDVRDVYLAGDVVVDAPDLALDSLESPPSPAVGRGR